MRKGFGGKHSSDQIQLHGNLVQLVSAALHTGHSRYGSFVGGLVFRYLFLPNQNCIFKIEYR